jgi:hypothetical protein
MRLSARSIPSVSSLSDCRVMQEHYKYYAATDQCPQAGCSDEALV